MKSVFNIRVRELKNYFGLSPKESLIALQNERKRTKLIDVQRRINMYLRALWGREFVIRQTADDDEKRKGNKPFVENESIYLPSSYEDITLNGVMQVTGLEIYRAASAHATAHIIYSKNHFHSKALDTWQKTLISTIEDARVEKLAFRRFPGLKKLWIKQHTASPLQNETAGDYLNRLARTLLDESYVDDDPWISQGRELFNAENDLEDNSLSWNIGMRLALAFHEKKIKFKIRSNMQSVPYRDDNRHLWDIAKPEADKGQIAPTTFFESKYLSLWEFARFGFGEKRKSPITFYDSEFLFAENEESSSDEGDEKTSVPESDEDANKISALLSHKAESGEKVPETYLYPEWNFRSQIETESWVTVREIGATSGDLQIIDNIIAKNNHLLLRMKVLLNAIRYGGAHRIRKLENGDEIDINSAIRAQIDLRLGVHPDPGL